MASYVSSPLHVEAHALVMAAQIASSLILQDPIFFTDCLGIAKAVAAFGSKYPVVLWQIRRQALQFQEITNTLRARTIHISWQLNQIAHSCAQHAMQAYRASPICSCRSETHSNLACPIVVAVQRLQLSGYVIIYVQCL
jgi:hypothetical protein